MRIMLVIYGLKDGGAERVLTIMANYWASKDWDVTLLTLENHTNSPAYELHPAVRYQPLVTGATSEPKPVQFSPQSSDVENSTSNIMDHAKASLKQVAVLRESYRRLVRYMGDRKRLVLLGKAIKENNPDVIVSFIDTMNLMVLSVTRNLSVPVIISERINPHVHYIGTEKLEKLRHRLYPKATHLVVQTADALSYFSPEVQERARIIPNPVILPDIPDKNPDLRNAGSLMIAMGRLVHQKGFDILLRAFASVASRHPSWRLEIWGEGPLRSELERQVIELGLQKRVRLHGLTKEPFKMLQRGDMFVLSSRYEGFPNVLCEAMACGLPVVSFDCPSGPREIIRDGIDGVLVPPEDDSALADTMSRLMGDEAKRIRLASNAPDVSQRFSLEKIMGMWEELILRCGT